MCPPAPLFKLVPKPIVYDPRPGTSQLHKHDEQIEKQRAHLHDLDLWAKRLKGPCLACRWREGGYERCTNPTVMKGQPNPVSGEVEWKGPPCQWERMPEYPEKNDWGNWTDERWRGPTLCGPEGLLFEPRTYQQFLIKWALNGLWLVPLCILGSCVIVNS